MSQPVVGDPSAMRAALAALWPAHRDDVNGLIDDLREFVAEPSAVGGDKAGRAAHRLAGSLGTFGLHDATLTARSIEALIDTWRETGRLDVADARQLVARLTAQVAEFDAIGVGAPEPTPPPVPTGRAIALVGLDATLARQLAEEAAVRRIRTRSFDGIGALADGTVQHFDAVVVDIDRVHVDALGLAGWPTDRTPFVALSMGRRLADRVAAARLGARRYVLMPTGVDAIVAAVESLWEQARRMPTVVAVDDDPVVLDTLRVLLADEVSLIAVDDQEQFWRALHDHAPDVVILDVDMPDITGIELCRVMRTDERWQQTGIIFLTAHRDASTLHKVFAAGADDMVVKPIIGPELRARVNSRIERTELHRRLAETDGLTGLANRATVERQLERAVTEAAAARPLSVALVDLDHFKRVNDVHGHRSGDDVLRRFADVVSLGEPSFAGRWGGEEFLVGFEGVAASNAVERMALVLDAFRRRTFVDGDGATFRCSFSAGIAEHPTDGIDGTELVRVADGALYEAKDRGRSRVVSVATLVASRPEPQVVDIVTVVGDEGAWAGLSSAGWRVASLADGHEAVRRLVGPLADLATRVVVLDTDAGGLDAIAVLQRLRSARLGVEVVVAAPTVGREAEAGRAGATATLRSPIDPAELSALVRPHLQRER